MIDEELDAAVRDTLTRSMPDRPLEPDPVAAVRRRVVGRRRRRRAFAVSAVSGLVALAATALVVGQVDDPEGREVVVANEPPTTEAPFTAGPPSTLAGPIEIEPDGVRMLPDPPLDVRGDAAVVWTGAELVVWGGDTRVGVAYSPDTGTWRQLAESPLPPGQEDTPVGVMTGRGVLVGRGSLVALWRPDEDRWQELPSSPGPVADLTLVGGSVVSHSANAALDLSTYEWRELPEPPLMLERPTTAWTGEELVVLGGPGTPFTSAAAIAYDPAADRWRTLPSPPDLLRAEALSADWDGRRIVAVNFDMTAATFDPSTDSWQQLPAVPARFSEFSPSVRSVGGTTSAFTGAAMSVLTEGDSWVPLPYGDVPIFRADQVPVGDERTLFVWGEELLNRRGRLVVVDPARMVEAASRTQVGVGSVGLAPGALVAETSYDPASDEEIRVVIDGPDGRCTAASRRASSPTGGPLEVSLTNDGRPTAWQRDASETTWETAATTSDLFTITCGSAEAARALAESASFAGPG